jgi:8-oxo-dGTP diphosphatase
MKNSTLCYIRKNNKTLMLHRVKKINDVHEGKWVGLGGKMEKGETPEECIKREVLEESGLTLKNPSLKGLLTFPAFKDGEDWYVFLFSASEYEGELTESNEGNLKWIDDEDLLMLPLWEGDKLFLSWMKQDKFFSAKFVYEEGELKESSCIFYS